MEEDKQKMIELTDDGVILHLADGSNVIMEYHFPINEDGQWHHLGLTYYSDINRVTLYYDTTYQQIDLVGTLTNGGE